MKKRCFSCILLAFLLLLYPSGAFAAVGENISWRDAERFFVFDGSSFLQAVWNRPDATLYLRLTMVMDALREPSAQGAGMRVVIYKDGEPYAIDSLAEEDPSYARELFHVEREVQHFPEESALKMTLKIQWLSTGQWPASVTYDVVALGPDGSGSRGISQQLLMLEPPITAKPTTPPKTTKPKTTKHKTTKAKTTKATSRKKSALTKSRKTSQKKPAQKDEANVFTGGALHVTSSSPVSGLQVKILLCVVVLAVLLAVLYLAVTAKKRKQDEEQDDKDE